MFDNLFYHTPQQIASPYLNRIEYRSSGALFKIKKKRNEANEKNDQAILLALWLLLSLAACAKPAQVDQPQKGVAASNGTVR